MPLFIIHGLIGYSLYGNEGFIMGILPDIIGFTPYFIDYFGIINTIQMINF